MAYDYESDLTSITGPNGLSDSFRYNGLGARVSKSGLSGTFSYNRLGAMPTSILINDGHNEYTAGVMVNGASRSVFNIQDRLASNVSQVDSAGNIDATAQTDGFGNPISSSGTFTGQLGFAGGYGYQTDSDTGLMLLGYRYYDPSTGRFLTQDPAQDGNNWYDYCANNPFRWLDPYGLWSLYKWLYTGDGNASNEVYSAALSQARRTLLVWGKHFAEDNGVAAPVGLATLGPVPKPIAAKLGLRVFRTDDNSPYTSGMRISQLASRGKPWYRLLKDSAKQVKNSQVEFWIVYEAGIAWEATYQTFHDPVSQE